MPSIESVEDIFTDDVIKHFKTNKGLITSDLLAELRQSQKGKDIAFKILDLERNEEGHYLDTFGNTISFKKIPSLKSINRKLPLHQIHIEEITKCSNDIFYFMDNYVKIATYQGINYPDLRHYQREFIETVIPDDNESIVALLPRQCCTASTTVTVINNDIEREQTFEELFNECKGECVK